MVIEFKKYDLLMKEEMENEEKSIKEFLEELLKILPTRVANNWTKMS